MVELTIAVNSYEMSSSESETECRTRWWDWEESGVTGNEVLVLSGAEDNQDTDEILTRISGLDEAKSAAISRKRSLQRTSFLKSDNAEKSKRTRVAHRKYCS